MTSQKHSSVLIALLLIASICILDNNQPGTHTRDVTIKSPVLITPHP